MACGSWVPTCGLLTRVSDVRFGGRVVSGPRPVASRWREARAVNKDKEGKGPPVAETISSKCYSVAGDKRAHGDLPGTCWLPTIESVSRPVRFPNSEGMDAGTPGNTIWLCIQSVTGSSRRRRKKQGRTERILCQNRHIGRRPMHRT